MTDDQRKVIQWLAGDDTGISSEALAFTFLSVKRIPYLNPPADPADLGRCLRLIRKVPAVREMVDVLGNKHRGWRKAACVWDQLAKCMKAEVGIDWRKGDVATTTWAAMKKAGL